MWDGQNGCVTLSSRSGMNFFSNLNSAHFCVFCTENQKVLCFDSIKIWYYSCLGTPPHARMEIDINFMLRINFHLNFLPSTARIIFNLAHIQIQYNTGRDDSWWFYFISNGCMNSFKKNINHRHFNIEELVFAGIKCCADNFWHRPFGDVWCCCCWWVVGWNLL